MRTAAALLLLAGAARAQVAPPAGGETVPLEPVTALAPPSPGLAELPPGLLEWRIPANLADALAAVPGLAMHHMGAGAAEPIVRGLGGDRVVVALDGLPLPNASPTRTASPAALIPGALPASVAVDFAPSSVANGPPAAAGYISLSTSDDQYRSYGSHRSYATYAAAAWLPDRDGGEVALAQRVAQGSWNFRAAFAAHDLGDTTAGNGTIVPAGDRAAGLTAAAGWNAPDGRGHLKLGALFARQFLAVNSALPLDTRNTDTAAFTAAGDWTVADATSIQLRAGIGTAEPHLDNLRRPAPAPVAADGRTRSLAAGLAVRHGGNDGRALAVGIDATREDRDLSRRRTGGVDRLWPDLRQDDLGAFAEWTGPLGAGWKLRLGARVDAATSAARAADALAFGRVIRALYATYNGAAATRTDRSDTAGAANLVLTGTLAPALTSTASLGFSRQAPGATERYRAFSDALGGGYEIGNPEADPENTTAIGWTLRWQHRSVSAKLTVFASEVDDYLHRVRIGTTAPPPPPPAGALVYGYRATDASFGGAELETVWHAESGAWIRAAASVVDGRDRTAHRSLPEIPPATLTAAAGREWAALRAKPWIEAGVRAVAAQRNPAPDQMPVFADTRAFTVLNVRGGFGWRGLRITLAAENLLDRLTFDYLAPPAAATPASGTLAPGARIPGPGRTFTLTISHGLP